MSTGVAPVPVGPAVMVTGYVAARLLVPTVHTVVPAQTAAGAVAGIAPPTTTRLPSVENVGVVVPVPRVRTVPPVVANGVDEALTLQPAAVPVASSTVYVSSATAGSDRNCSAPDIVVPHARAVGVFTVMTPPVRVSVPVIVQPTPDGFAPVHGVASAVPPANRIEAPIPPVSRTEAPKSDISRFLVVRIKYLMSVRSPV
jgi:hypothetical protein